MRPLFVMLLFFSTSLLAKDKNESSNESTEALLRFHKRQTDDVAINYLFTKNLSNIYTLKLSKENTIVKEKVINPKDASILIAQMNDMLWDFEYKKKPFNSTCSLFADLAIAGSKTSICSKEKLKAAKILGIRGRLDYLLK